MLGGSLLYEEPRVGFVTNTQHHDLMSLWHSGYYIDVVYNTNLLKGIILCFSMLSWELDLTQYPKKIRL